MAAPAYLRPYLDAVARHGTGFDSLLWANPPAQAARFAALAHWSELQNRVVLDAGCGRADFLLHLLSQGIRPAKYIGIEAVEALAGAAEENAKGTAKIIHGDFIRNPGLLDQNADVIVFCGSLNTLTTREFYSTLDLAWKRTGSELAFNFLCSPRLASSDHLTWHAVGDIHQFALTHTRDIAIDDSYRDGDCTFVLRKQS